MKSGGAQFWILLILSLIVSLLMVGQIFLSHAIIKGQHLVVDARKIAATEPDYKTAWQRLAVNIWKSGAQDPALLDLLKSEGIDIRQGPPPGSTPAAQAQPATNAAPLAPDASKPGTALPPATP